MPAPLPHGARLRDNRRRLRPAKQICFLAFLLLKRYSLPQLTVRTSTWEPTAPPLMNRRLTGQKCYHSRVILTNRYFEWYPNIPTIADVDKEKGRLQAEGGHGRRAEGSKFKVKRGGVKFWVLLFDFRITNSQFLFPVFRFTLFDFRYMICETKGDDGMKDEFMKALKKYEEAAGPERARAINDQFEERKRIIMEDNEYLLQWLPERKRNVTMETLLQKTYEGFMKEMEDTET
jgi:hypothetical protein